MILRALALCVGSLLALAPLAHAAPILDQHDEAFEGAVNFYALAQTFTVGIDGNLVGIDVATFTDGPTTIAILGTIAGVPDYNNQLASVLLGALPHQGGLGFQPTVFFAPIPVSVGDVLALAVFSNLEGGGGTSNWNTDFGGGSYAGGMAYRSIGSTPLNGFTPLVAFDQTADLLFRTYVDSDVVTKPVPEPGTMTLLLGGLAFGARRRVRSMRQGSHQREPGGKSNQQG